MSFSKLKIIGERLNPGFKSTNEMFVRRDIPGLARLAAEQTAKGASYLNINTGSLAETEPDFQTGLIAAVQKAAPVPLSFDYPNVSVQERCLAVYDERLGGGKPFINSIGELRWEMTELLHIRHCRVILMASERNENGRKVANRTAEEVYGTARRMTERLLRGGYGLTPDDIYIDVSVCPIAADTEGLTRMAVQAIRRIGACPHLRGVHMSVGLTNLSIMLPAKTSDGQPFKELLESAFLTNTIPFGLDTVLGTAGRNYRHLPPDHPVLIGFNEALELSDVEALLRIQQLYMAQ